MTAFSQWLSEKPRRATALNSAMLTLLLTMIGSPFLFNLVGGIALALCALFCLHQAVNLTLERWRGAHLFELLLLWVPGALALALSIAGLLLISASAMDGSMYALGIVLFGLELTMLSVFGADLQTALNEQFGKTGAA